MPIRKDFIGETTCLECGATVGVYEDAHSALVYKCNGLADQDRAKCGAFHRFGHQTERDIRKQIREQATKSDDQPKNTGTEPGITSTDAPESTDTPDELGTGTPEPQPSPEPDPKPGSDSKPKRKRPSVGIASIL